ncbi:MAG TPA: hexokinase [Clostridiales bacterium]|nr:hexokinase [Clostridiales bacterium]
MDYESIDVMKECEIFLEDMQKGLNGHPDCLDMLPTYIPMNDHISINEPVIVMDAGGTNFRVAVVTFDSNLKPVIQDFANYPMPGVKEEIDRDEFLKTIVEYIKPVIHKSNKIGFCFSYPTEILPNGDGVLLRFSKEIKVQGMVGLPVGAGILEALKKAGYTEPKKIVLLNDTVATLLGGKAAYADRHYDSFIGFILGTGTNTSYIENVNNIGKINVPVNEYSSMIINIESGNYRQSPSGRIDKEYDQTTYNPGQSTFEKKISGGYLGGLTLSLLKNAAEAGLLSDAFLNNIRNIMDLTTIDVNEFLHEPYGKNLISNACSMEQEEGRRDRTTLYYLIDSLVERAAKLVAINLISVVIKSGKGQDPCRPVCITADGSTFYKLKNFKSKLEHYMKVYLVDQLNLHYEFVEAENSNLTGSAVAALAKLS